MSRKINTRRTPARRVQENEVQEEIPPLGEEVHQVPQDSCHDPIVPPRSYGEPSFRDKAYLTLWGLEQAL